MKLSEILYERALPIWREAEEKPFVLEMAKGTLAEGKFKRYMLQDYLYLQDYSDILKSALLQAKEPALALLICRRLQVLIVIGIRFEFLKQILQAFFLGCVLLHVLPPF